MDITALSVGERATVIKITEPYRQRLFALNLREGEEVVLLRVSLFHKTYLIEAGSKIAMRREIARCIQIVK